MVNVLTLAHESVSTRTVNYDVRCEVTPES
jgi:hypothetical protein